MSTRPDHSEWFELVAGHALHALDATDEARVTEHLAGCEECRHELDGHALTASHLASLADDAETAPPVWSAIRSAVVGSAADGAAPATVADLAARRERGRPARWLLAAAAVVLVIAGATVASVQVLHSQDGSSDKPVAIAQCGGIRGCLQIDLRSSDGVRRATVLVSNGSAEVQPVALQAPTSGRTFVLWQLPRGGAPIPLGEFGSTTEPSHSTALAVSMAQTTGFAVSSEPADTQPTTPSDVLALGGVTS